jgi:hypothetical protein
MCAHTSLIQKVEQLEEQYQVKLSDESQLEYYPVSTDLFNPKVNSDVKATLIE